MTRRPTRSRVTPKGTAPATKGSLQARRAGPEVVAARKDQLRAGWKQTGRGQGFVPPHGQKSGQRGNR